MRTVLDHPEGQVLVEARGDRRVVDVRLHHGGVCPIAHCETSYPLTLISTILRVKGPAFLVDEILRDENPDYVEKALYWAAFPFVRQEAFRGRRLLDFGCGSGASTVVLARLLPESEIVGVELEGALLDNARARCDHYGLQNRVRFLQSPDALTLPPGLGEFDYAFLAGVYEHLLPDERTPILQQIWNSLRPGGVLFITQTPNRHSLLEFHTTGGIPLLNYMPDALAHRTACRLARSNLKGQSWPALLRAGIRGASKGEIVSILGRFGPAETVHVLPLQYESVKDDVSLWYHATTTMTRSQRVIKTAIRLTARILMPLKGLILPSIQLAIQKRTPTG